VPSGLRHCTEYACPGTLDGVGDFERCEAVHAEINALLQCPNLTIADTIYVSVTPCFSCAKAICNTPIRRIVALEWYGEGRGRELLERAGKKIEVPTWT
jgi:dCMP deaminase